MQQEFSLSSEMHNFFSEHPKRHQLYFKNFYRTFIVKKLKTKKEYKKNERVWFGSIIYARLYFINIYYLHIITSYFYFVAKNRP